MELKDMKNNVNVQGLLMDNTLEVKVDGKGKRYISGTLEINTGEESVVPISLFAYELKNNGEKSKLYDSMSAMIEWPSARTVGKAHAPKVQIRGARLENNNFYSAKDDKIISTWRINGGFGSLVAPDAQDKNDFEIEGIISSIKEVVDKEGESTNSYQLKLLNVGRLGKAVNELTLTFDDPKAVDYINNNYNNGDLVVLNGRIEYEQKQVVISKELGFGEPIQQTYTNTTKLLKITAGTQPISPDDHGINIKDLQTIIVSQNNQIEEKAKAKTTAEAAKTPWSNVNNLLF